MFYLTTYVQFNVLFYLLNAQFNFLLLEKIFEIYVFV